MNITARLAPRFVVYGKSANIAVPAAGKEESILNRLTDKALLLLYALGSCLLIQPDPVYVGFFFLAVTFSAFRKSGGKISFSFPDWQSTG